MERVHCPRCGEQMARDQDGHLNCPNADDWLSPRMNDLLPKLAAEDATPPASSKPIAWGRGWHCLADGNPMEPGTGFVRCPVCGRCLAGSLLYELTEFNVHERV